jgi:hypothetical protein
MTLTDPEGSLNVSLFDISDWWPALVALAALMARRSTGSARAALPRSGPGKR